MPKPKKARRERGTGRLWQIGHVWWMQYYCRGQQVRESSHSDVKMVAEKLLERRLDESRAGETPAVRMEQVRYEHLRDALYADYKANGRRSLYVRKDGTVLVCGIPDLDAFFARYKATYITTDRIRAFVAKRQAAGAPNSTINRSLAALRRMFHLAIQDGKLRDVPYIPMLKEPPARKGFLEHADFLRLRLALPDYLRAPVTLAFYTGMRLGEIKGLRWSNVSLKDGQIQLDPGTTKNDEPRIVPLVAELTEMLRILREQTPGSDLVFTRAGLPLGNFTKAWASACRAAGLTGRIFHDLRRTGVRNLVRAGVPERVAMALSGHKTRAVFERYNIVSGRDVKDAGRKVETYLAEQDGISSGQMAVQAADEALAQRRLVN
jgi:integrase